MHKLTSTDGQIWRYLQEWGLSTAVDIAEEIHVHQSHVRRSASRLAREGYLIESKAPSVKGRNPYQFEIAPGAVLPPAPPVRKPHDPRAVPVQEGVRVIIYGGNPPPFICPLNLAGLVQHQITKGSP